MHSRWLLASLLFVSCTGQVMDLPHIEDAGSGGGASATGGGGGGAATGGGASATGGGAATGGGSSVDPLSTDRANFFGDTRCATSGLAFCEDFESRTTGQAPDPAKWTLQFWDMANTTLAVDDTRAARGMKAVKIHQSIAINRAVMTTRTGFPLTKFWMRMFLYVREVPPPMHWDNQCMCLNPGVIHWTYAFAQGDTTFGDGVRKPEIRAGDFINEGLFVNEDGMGDGRSEVGQGDDMNKPAGYDMGMRPGEWQCLEFLWDAPGKEVKVFWDGREHPSLNVKNKAEWAFPDANFSSLTIGLSHYQNYPLLMNGLDVWIDEVAIDPNRIGCVR